MTVKLLVLAGPPCAGKSTLAEAIARRFGFRWLHTDRILSSLIPGSDRRKSDRDLAYRATLIVAEELLRGAHSVVLDATYGSYEHRKAVEACAAALGIPLFLIQCRVPPDLAVDRFKGRGDHPATDLSEARVRDLASRYRYFDRGITLPAETPLAEALRRVEDYLRTGEPVACDGAWSAMAVGYTS